MMYTTGTLNKMHKLSYFVNGTERISFSTRWPDSDIIGIIQFFRNKIINMLHIQVIRFRSL